MSVPAGGSALAEPGHRLAGIREVGTDVGDDYQAVIRVSGPADREQERYPLLEEKLEIDLSGLSGAEIDRLVVVVNRAIEQVCTVGRTLKAGATVTFDVTNTAP